ncbi:MAG: hypothetical protein II309_06690, partial [Bacilli bacterium]|nr:hypothetical protein [Bacilli bacterium]
EKEKAEKEKAEKENKAKEKEVDSLIDMMVPVEPQPAPAPVVEMPKMPTIEEVKQEVVSEPIEEQIKETVIEDLFASDPVMEKINIPKKEEPVKPASVPVNNHISGMTVKRPEYNQVPVTPKYNPYIQKNNDYIDNKKNDNNYISDDQFFDDFFGEDD